MVLTSRCPPPFPPISVIHSDHTVWELDCGNVISDEKIVSGSDCCLPCNGNVNENCGALRRLNVYRNNAVPPPVPVIAPNYGQWVSLGCYT